MSCWGLPVPISPWEVWKRGRAYDQCHPQGHCPPSLEGLTPEQEEGRGILSQLLGVAQPWTGSTVCLCVCVWGVVGHGAGSKGKQKYSRYTVHTQRQLSIEEGVKALAHGGCWCAFCPCFRLAHLRVHSPSTLLAAAFPCWFWTLMPKITRRVLPLVGHSLPWLLGRLAYFLKQTSHLPSLSYFLWPPFPASLRPWRLPFYCSCSSESRRVAAHPCGPESPASVLWGILVSHCVPVASAGAVESRGGEAWAVCALQFSPALFPGPVDQMSYSLHAERCCWDSLSPCSARPVQSCCQPAVKVEEASHSFLPGPAKGEGNSHVSSAWHSVSAPPHLIPQWL